MLPEVSETTAFLWHNVANAGLILGAALVFIGTLVLFWADGEIKRHDDLRISSNEAETKRAIESAALANDSAAKSNERAAELEAKAALLKLELDREIQKRAPRTLSEEQKSKLISELRGKLHKVNLVVYPDGEAKDFAREFVLLFGQAGIKFWEYEMHPGDAMPVPAGKAVMMYSPLKAKSEGELADDPLYRALKSTGLFGGYAARPFLSPGAMLSFTQRGFDSPAKMLPEDEYALYIFNKSPR